jgi:hypothetical protein
MFSRRLLFQWALALCLAAKAWSQAAVEYAAKSAQSVGGGSAGGDAYLGSCRVDNTLISCVSHTYPLAFQVSVLAICAGAIFLFFRRQRV